MLWKHKLLILLSLVIISISCQSNQVKENKSSISKKLDSLKVTLNFYGTPLSDVVRVIEVVTESKIILSSEIQSNIDYPITLTVLELKYRHALDVLCYTADLSWQHDHKQIILSNKNWEPEKDLSISENEILKKNLENEDTSILCEPGESFIEIIDAISCIHSINFAISPAIAKCEPKLQFFPCYEKVKLKSLVELVCLCSEPKLDYQVVSGVMYFQLSRDIERKIEIYSEKK